MPEVLDKIESLVEMGEFSDDPIENEPVSDFVDDDADDGDDVVADTGDDKETEEAKEEETATLPEDYEDLKATAQRFSDLVDLLQNKPADAIAELSGKTPEEIREFMYGGPLPEDYEPANALEKAVLPHVQTLQQLPTHVAQVQDAFKRHADLLDNATMTNQFLMEALGVLAEAQGVKVPEFDPQTFVKAAYAGKDYRALIKEAFKGESEKVKVKVQQKDKVVPKTPKNETSVRSLNGKTRLRDYFKDVE